MRRRSDTIALFVCLIVASISLTMLASYHSIAADRAKLTGDFGQNAFQSLVDRRHDLRDLSKSVKSGNDVIVKSERKDVVFKAYNMTHQNLATLKKVLENTKDYSVDKEKNVTKSGEKGVEIPTIIIGNKSLCNGVDILVYVQSKVGNFMARRNIRRTWAAGNIFKTLKLRTMFILGKPDSQDDQIRINNEQILHGDIIEGNFTDSYYNLVLKSVIAMHWVRHHCAGVKYVIKVDDDMFLNSFKVVELVLPNLSHKTIACHVVKAGTSPIVRDKNSKWYIPHHIFPNQTHLPQFCSGYVVLMTSRLVSDLYSRVKSTPLFHVDDVYMFGQLTQALGNVNFLDIRPNCSLSQDKGLDEYKAGRQNLLTVNVKGSAAMEDLWSRALMNLSPWAKDNTKVNTNLNRDA